MKKQFFEVDYGYGSRCWKKRRIPDKRNTSFISLEVLKMILCHLLQIVITGKNLGARLEAKNVNWEVKYFLFMWFVWNAQHIFCTSSCELFYYNCIYLGFFKCYLTVIYITIIRCEILDYLLLEDYWEVLFTLFF